VAAAASRIDVLSRSLERMLSVPRDELSAQILPIGNFDHIIPIMIEKAQRLLQDARDH
jgi:hypothetical protein